MSCWLWFGRAIPAIPRPMLGFPNPAIRLVELGVLRLLTNPAVTLGAVSAATAMAVLREAVQHPGHQFWPLDQDLVPGLEDFTSYIAGHQQWNDAVLLLQASAHDATLVSFDAGLKQLAKDSQTGRVLLLQER